MKRSRSFITHSVTLILLSWKTSLLAFTPNPSCNSHHPHPHLTIHQTSPENGHSPNQASTPLFSTANHPPTNHTTPPKVTGVTLKMAFDSSPTWGVAESTPTSQRFTSPQSLDMVHRLRRESCAVLVGRATVERDDCSLTVRRVEMEGGRVQPVRVVLDPELKLIGREFVVLTDGLPTLVYHAVGECTAESEDGKTREQVSDSVTLVEMKKHPDNQQCALSPLEILRDLSSRGLHHIMVEGGPATARLFLNAKLVDRAILVRAPIQFALPVPAGFDEETLKEAGLTMIGTSMMGGDKVEYWTKAGTEWPASELSLWP
ncbi:hypothetical protein HJC23_001538 [Cyclotella cryptica]|uniref:Bacterial bifunctional deaminase-reductase C-terminal domain-containing protein n=1 Tax=Cyclotella cryptica TaxID=29204 RepID=A0ABD3Q2C0_9STRA|eukprot:CCRYP_010752-RA/>CCRYP_010752-RA protein AED:0.36 eAED:0.36 QI:0/-1/0/1/-1/1/1/0/316